MILDIIGVIGAFASVASLVLYIIDRKRKSNR